jgi:hypothetical protein
LSGLTRREALVAGLGLVAAGCGGSGGGSGSGFGAAGGLQGPGGPGAAGSTLVSTWVDRGGTGVLARGPGDPLLARTELGRPRALGAVLATFAHVTDAHVLDASSPARVPFLDRLGPPFQSTFRPHEALTAQVLTGMVHSVRALRPDAVIQGGDLIDNDQANELARALAALRGGRVDPGRYFGVQVAGDADPFYYRPDLDAPRHPGLLAQASRPWRSPGVGAGVLPVLGDHDILVAGELPPDEVTRRLAVGGEALWELPPGLTASPGTELTAGGSPDGPPLPGAVDRLLAEALAGPKVRVPADPERRELSVAEVVAALRPGHGPTLDYAVDVGPMVRVIVLDLARRGGGSGGLVRPDQPGWLASQLSGAGDRWILAVSHQPLAESEGGELLLAELDRHPRVIAALCGHTHHSRITPRPTSAGGYWLIETASLIDYPQQARALRVRATADGGVALECWMLDHTLPGDLGTISRQLAYLDAQGGRPAGFGGTRADRNVILFRRPPR